MSWTDVIEISPFNLWVFSDLIKWAVFKGFSNHTVRGQIGQEGGYVVYGSMYCTIKIILPPKLNELC